MSTNTTLSLVLTTALCSGCTVGNGRMVSELRTVPAFDAVDADDAIEVTITVEGQASDQTQLVVDAESNIMDHVLTTVAGGTLHADVHDVRTLREVRVAGSTDHLEAASADNASLLVVLGVSSDAFEAWADNAAQVELEGEVQTLDLVADNAAFVSAAALVARDVSVELDNAASGEICATGVVTGIVDNAAHLTILCGGDASRVIVRNGASVTW